MKLGRVKFKTLIVILSLFVLLAGAGYIINRVVLRQIEKRIETHFGFDEIHLGVFPPSVVIEDLRSKSMTPFIASDRVRLQISSGTLWSKSIQFNVFMEHPVVRMEGIPQEKNKREKDFDFVSSLPVGIHKGVISNGELYFWAKGMRIFSKKIEALIFKKKDRLELKMEAEENIFDFGDEREKIKGKMNLILEGKGKEFDIRKLNIRGNGCILKAEGKLLEPFNPRFHLKSFFNLPAEFASGMFHLPFDWQGKLEGEGMLTRKNRTFLAQADFSSRNLVLNDVDMGKVEGNVDYNQKKGGTVELNIQKNRSSQEFVKIRFEGNKIKGEARRFHLDPIVHFISLPWPVLSPVWGEFTMKRGRLNVEMEFRDQLMAPLGHEFPFQGKLNLFWDGDRRVSFKAPDLRSTFAHVELDGELSVGRNMDISIEGEVNHLQQARIFTEEFLGQEFKFPETQGKGKAKLQIFGPFKSPQLYARFSFSPGIFDRFEVNKVQGEAELIKNEFFGRFNLKDPVAEGKVSLFSSPQEFRTEIQLQRGKIEKILPKIDVPVPLTGEVSGNFEYTQKDGEPHFQGDFSSPHLEMGGQEFSEVNGKINWSPDKISFPSLQFDYLEGQVEGILLLNTSKDHFDVNVEGRNINISSFHPHLKGNLNFNMEGQGTFGKNKAKGKVKIQSLKFPPLQKTDFIGEAKLGLSSNTLQLDLDGNFSPGKNRFQFSLKAPLFNNTVSGKVAGSFENFDLVIPWTGAKGKINYMAELSGKRAFPRFKGAIDFQGSVFPFPQFPHALRDFSGLIFVENNEFSLRSFQGKLGRGNLKGNGQLTVGDKGIKDINLQIEGKDMLLSPLERTRALTDGSLSLTQEDGQLNLKGKLFVDRLSWRREFTEKFEFYPSPYYQPEKKSDLLENLKLNLRLEAEDNARIENSLVNLETRFDLNVKGDLNSPVILGDIEALSGEAYFQDREFRIVKGEVSFFDPLRIEPYLNFKGETYIKDYRVTFSLQGFLDNLKPQFNSSPPLPPEDVLALITLGQSFRRTYSYEKSTRQSTASLLSFQLSEEAEKRAEKLFSIDRFRIDPFIMGSSAEMTARLTVGKKITRNFFIYYSTNLSTQREEIARLEWELTRDLSVVGTRQEDGRLSFDFKIHKRF
ncbi:translocation/assembly module TamB [bacterium]|nr:translocation/assembly module TamB [bacterium]